MERPDWATNEHHWRANCREIIERSRDLLDEASRCHPRCASFERAMVQGRDEQDENFRLFRLIGSDSDALPAGPERAQWSVSALEREDARIAASEDHWRAQALTAARNLILKYT